MTYDEEQHWRNRGVDAINAEMDRRITVRLEKLAIRRASGYAIRQLRRDWPGWSVKTVFRARTFDECRRWMRHHERRRVWVEHAARPAYVRQRWGSASR